MECGSAIFVRALAHTHEPAKDTLFSLIDVVSGLVLVFSASMKAEMCSYQKCVSVFIYIYTSVFPASTLGLRFQKFPFSGEFSSYACKR